MTPAQGVLQQIGGFTPCGKDQIPVYQGYPVDFGLMTLRLGTEEIGLLAREDHIYIEMRGEWWVRIGHDTYTRLTDRGFKPVRVKV